MMSDSPSIRAFGEKEKPADIETLLEKVITLADEDSENEDDVKYLGTSCSVVNPKKRHISPTRNGKENSTLFNFKRLRLLTPRDYFKQIQQHMGRGHKLSLDQLPYEVIAQILRSLSSPDDLLKCRQVSTAWNELACFHLRNIHPQIELERMSQLKHFITTMQNMIPGQRFPFTKVSLNLVTLSRKSLELLLAQPELDIKEVTLTTEGLNGKSKRKQEDGDPVPFILGKLPGLTHVTIMLHNKNASGDIPLVTSYCKAMQHLPSVGLTSIILGGHLLDEFALLTQVQPLRLTKLGIEFVNGDGTDRVLDLFYSWLEAHSATLVYLSINSCFIGVRIPTLPKLQHLSLGIHSNEQYRMDTFAAILPDQFPSLTTVCLNSFLLTKSPVKYDSAIGAFGNESFPTVQVLELTHIVPEFYKSSFPNLEKLVVGPRVTEFTFLNILSYYMEIKHLAVTFSQVKRDWWEVLTGGAKRRPRDALLSTAVVDVERDFVVGGPRRNATFLGNLTELKSLRVDECHKEVVDALVYLTANQFIPPLEKLTLNTLASCHIVEYPPELLTTLRNYHAKVTAQ